ncbi:MAG: DMT family transporter [Streptosporangiaceae bacterium]
MVVVFALLAALSNATSAVTQHMASTAGKVQLTGWRLIVFLVRKPLWLLGAAAQVAAFVFQALALHNGELSVVQPLLVTELVLVLVLRRVWLHQSIAMAAWNGAVLACAGLSVFLIAGEPGGGRPVPESGHWVAAVVVIVVAAIALAFAGRRGSPGHRATLYAVAAGITWALEATFIKATTDTITQFGVGGMFLHWPVYAVAVGGAAGVLLEQEALHVGPLRVSQPIMVITDPIVSIALSVWLFDEHFMPNGWVLAAAAAGFAVMCVGVVYLTLKAPETMEADAGDPAKAVTP